MSYVTVVDIGNDELVKYAKAVEAKKGTCRFLPAGRFASRTNDPMIRFVGLTCRSVDGMAGEATGMGAESCTNCGPPPRSSPLIKRVTEIVDRKRSAGWDPVLSIEDLDEFTGGEIAELINTGFLVSSSRGIWRLGG